LEYNFKIKCLLAALLNNGAADLMMIHDFQSDTRGIPCGYPGYLGYRRAVPGVPWSSMEFRVCEDSTTKVDVAVTLVPSVA